MSRRWLFALFALEVALAVLVGAYSISPARLSLLGRLANTAFGVLPVLLCLGFAALTLLIFLRGRRSAPPPAPTEESRTLAELEHEVRVNPSAYNLFQLARFCLKTSRYAAAARDYSRVLELEQDRVQARYGHGIALFRTGHIEKAIRELEIVHRQDPSHDYGQIEVRLAEAYLRAADPESALRILDCRRSLGIAEYHYLRGQALEKIGQIAEARSQHLLVLEAAAISPAHRKEKDRHLAQLARQFLVRKANQPSAQ